MIVNACDGEPLVGKDAVLLDQVPGLVIDGAALVARASRAREVLIAVHAGSPTESRVAALLTVEHDRLPGARLLRVPPRYVSSEPSALAALASGAKAQPVTRDPP